MSRSPPVYLQEDWADPRDTLDSMGYGQRVGDTHSTGMHSCCIWIRMCSVLFEFFMNI